MKKQIDFRIVSLVFSVLVICFAIAFYVVAWDEPGSVPPTGNVSPPLNVSNDPQIKSGSLRLGGLTVDNDTWLATSAGNVGIGTTNPDLVEGGPEILKLDVEGAIGAIKYCDGDGNNCQTATALFGGCEVLHPYSESEVDSKNNYIINIPSYCIDKICNIIIRRYSDGQSYNDGAVVSYHQEEGSNIWVTADHSGGINGDGSQGKVIDIGGGDVKLYDDSSGYENDADKWTLNDNHSGYGSDLMVCTELYGVAPGTWCGLRMSAHSGPVFSCDGHDPAVSCPSGYHGLIFAAMGDFGGNWYTCVKD